MQNENTTAPPKAQHPYPNSHDPLPVLNAIVPDDNWHEVVALLMAERTHASIWWTILNEMRFRKLLPDWAIKLGAGSHPSWDKWDADCRASNLALLAYDGHLNAVNHPSGEFAPHFENNENVARESGVKS